MKPAWPLHSPSVIFLFRGFVEKWILQDTRELLETMGTTSIQSCLERQGERVKGMEKEGEGGMMGERGWLGKGAREE